MKKFILLTAALLLSLLAHSQEADSLSLRPEVNIVARGEYSTIPDSHHLGNSSLYVTVDGALSEVLSYSAELHLLSADPASLYKSSLSGIDSDWLDWAYFDFSFGQFYFDLGKLSCCFNTWEYDAYDFDCYYELASTPWNEVKAYQWGGRIGWVPSEAFSMDFSMVTSAFADPVFASGKFQYRLAANVKGGDLYGGLFSLNHFQCRDNETSENWCDTYFAMGHKFTFSSWELFLDNISRIQKGKYAGSVLLSANYTLSEKWAFGARFTADSFSDKIGGGLMATWYPLETLRVHALTGYDNITANAFFNIGVTWTIRLLK